MSPPNCIHMHVAHYGYAFLLYYIVLHCPLSCQLTPPFPPADEDDEDIDDDDHQQDTGDKLEAYERARNKAETDCIENASIR